MRLGDLCAAAVGMSDNTAGNLILATVGGPAGLTRYCRSLGDRITRLDRTEPTLNLVADGDVRDTTTPAAMLDSMRGILLGSALSASSRGQLESWLVEAKVGADRIPAGLPQGFRVGHKTGTGPAREANDIAIIWPGARAPLLVACFYKVAALAAAHRSGVLAEVGCRVAAVASEAPPRPLEPRIVQLFHAAGAHGAAVVRDAATGGVVASAGVGRHPAARLLPLSAVKLFTAAAWWAHGLGDGAFIDPRHGAVTLHDALVFGYDRPAEVAAVELRRGFGAKAVLDELRSYGLSGDASARRR